MFPLGNLTKPEVRQIAKDRGLWTARKKESMGVCFVGNVGMREFLSQYITTRPGDIIDKESGRVLGRHDGAIFLYAWSKTWSGCWRRVAVLCGWQKYGKNEVLR